MFNRDRARLRYAQSFYSTTDSYDTRNLLKARQDLNRTLGLSPDEQPAFHSDSETDEEEELEEEGGVKDVLNLFRGFLRRNNRVQPDDLEAGSSKPRPARSLLHSGEDTILTYENEVESKSGKNSDTTQTLVRVRTDQTEMNYQELPLLEEDCATLISVCHNGMRIALITERASPNAWTPQQLYRKVLSNMALNDSIRIGHPYYWHPMVRRRLSRVVKQFRKLYKSIDDKKAQGNEDQTVSRQTVRIPKNKEQEQEHCQFQMITDGPSMNLSPHFLGGWSVSVVDPQNVEVIIKIDTDSDSESVDKEPFENHKSNPFDLNVSHQPIFQNASRGSSCKKEKLRHKRKVRASSHSGHESSKCNSSSAHQLANRMSGLSSDPSGSGMDQFRVRLGLSKFQTPTLDLESVQSVQGIQGPPMVHFNEPLYTSPLSEPQPPAHAQFRHSEIPPADAAESPESPIKTKSLSDEDLSGMMTKLDLETSTYPSNLRLFSHSHIQEVGEPPRSISNLHTHTPSRGADLDKHYSSLKCLDLSSASSAPRPNRRSK